MVMVATDKPEQHYYLFRTSNDGVAKNKESETKDESKGLKGKVTDSSARYRRYELT